MRTIRILGIIVILALVWNVVKEFTPGFVDGWNSVDDYPSLPQELSSVSLSVRGYKEGVTPDSLFNRAMQCAVPCEPGSINTYISHGAGDYMVFAVFPFLLLCIYGFYCLIRLLVSVSKGEILTRKNMRRLRFFIYPVVVSSALFELQRYLLYRSAVRELVSSDYVFSDFHLKYSWVLMLVLVLLTEIFSQAVRIKEENDLTI